MSENNSFGAPLLDTAWKYIPEGIRKTIQSESIIPEIAAKAKIQASQNPDFIRSDQGQIMDVFPTKEIYYGPSSGLVELRDLVSQFWTFAFDLKEKNEKIPDGLDRRNVAITNGATEGLSIVMHIYAPSQKVGVMSLHWSNYRGVIQNAGGTPVVVPLFNKDYELDLAAAEKIIKKNNITSLLINFPNNPAGDVLTPDELKKMAALARKMNLILISDEVYNFIRYKGSPYSMLSYAPERTVVVSSASKDYLIPGARVGYVISTETVLTDSWMPKLIRSFSSCPNVLGQHLLMNLLKREVQDFNKGRNPRIITKIKKELWKRCQLILSVLKERGFHLAGRDRDHPSGAISVLVSIPAKVTQDDRDFVNRAIEAGKFSAVPGSVFGASGCIRFGYAGMSQKKIKQLSWILQDFLESYSKP
jgi:aspartate/methionine/tyrosine aminotransferase